MLVLTAARPAEAQAPDRSGSRAVTSEQDAGRTRSDLRELLGHYPPTLPRVLRLDPTLFNNPAYLAPYPALVAFLQLHPEVAHDSAFYLDYVSTGGYTAPDRSTQILNVWKDILAGLMGITIFGIFMATLVWVVRSVMDYRRWHRLSKTQADVHGKMIDRLTANEDLLAYMQTPAGNKFLQSAPIALDGKKAMSAPLGRILWSVQTGLVLAAGGLGLQFVSGRVDPDAAQPLFGVGVLAMALGLGFVVSALVSYVLSRRLGLFDPAPAPVVEPGPTRPV
jgi:hypothetical protein